MDRLLASLFHTTYYRCGNTTEKSARPLFSSQKRSGFSSPGSKHRGFQARSFVRQSSAMEREFQTEEQDDEVFKYSMNTSCSASLAGWQKRKKVSHTLRKVGMYVSV